MADREKVLNGLEACADRTGALCRTCPYDFRKEGCISDMAEDALELLKDEPSLVLNIVKFNCYHGDCPACGKRIHYNFTKYCPRCGKRVKWG